MKLDLLIYVLFLFWLYRLIILLIIILRSKKVYKKAKLNDNIKYFIVLPVYKEEKAIVRTIEFYNHLIWNSENIYLIVVWTSKERDISWINKTLELAKQYIQKNIIIIEADTKWFMAHQVNYAVNYIKNTLKTDINSSYFHLINIDTRIKKEDIFEIFIKINEWEDILLQSTLFVENFNKINNFQKAISIYQSRWTLVEEQYRILFNRHISKYKLYHIVWHWLIIKLKKYFQYKMLPEDTINEDLHFWFYLSLENEKVYSLTQYEFWDTPTTFYAWFKQTISWFFWLIEYYQYPKSYIQKFNKQVSLKLIFYTLQWFLNSIQWFLTSYYLFFIFLYSIITNNFIIWLISILIYFLHYYVFIIWLYKKNIIKQLRVNYFFLTTLVPFIVSIPLTISLLKYLLYKLWFLNSIKNKTDHE